jgi:tripartite-type tricarboxylate transporter receptor subunit TctC
MQRRQLIQLMTSVAALPVLCSIARADAYPARPVRMIVGFPPGSAADIDSRLIGDWLSQRLGQQFVVDNRPGAGSNIGAEIAAHSAPDGYTLFTISTVNAVNASLYPNLSFGFLQDFAPVAGILRTPLIMEVNPSLPVKSVAEFISYAKANPGKVNFASSGNGTGSHVAAELFRSMTGVAMTHVPYHGPAQALTDLISGRVEVMFDVLTSSMAHVRTGEVRGIAVTTATRSSALPDLPTVGDTVPGYEVSGWAALVAAKNTPAEAIGTLNTAVNAGLADPTIVSRLAALGAQPLVMPPAEVGKLMVDEAAKWAKVVKFANNKVESSGAPSRCTLRCADYLWGIPSTNPAAQPWMPNRTPSSIP